MSRTTYAIALSVTFISLTLASKIAQAGSALIEAQKREREANNQMMKELFQSRDFSSQNVNRLKSTLLEPAKAKVREEQGAAFKKMIQSTQDMFAPRKTQPKMSQSQIDAILKKLSTLNSKNKNERKVSSSNAKTQDPNVFKVKIDDKKSSQKKDDYVIDPNQYKRQLDFTPTEDQK